MAVKNFLHVLRSAPVLHRAPNIIEEVAAKTAFLQFLAYGTYALFAATSSILISDKNDSP